MAEKGLEENSKSERATEPPVERASERTTPAERMAATVWERPGKRDFDENLPGRSTLLQRLSSPGSGSNESIHLSTHKHGKDLPNLTIHHYDKFDHSDKNKDSSQPRAIEERHTTWRGKDVSLTLKDGVAVRYKDGDGTVWTSDDGKGWLRESDGILGRQAKISFGDNGVSEDSPYGVTKTYSSDGALTQSFKTASGENVSLKQNADGSQVLSDGGKNWVSSDGKNWSNGTEQKQAEYRIDENGRLFAKKMDGVESTEKSSERFEEINNRINELSSKYNIKFGKPPEQIKHEDEDPADKKLDLRYPTMDELNVLEEGLKRYAHIAKKNGTDFEGLRFNWVASNEKSVEVTEHGWHDGGENPSISFAPKDAAKTFGWDGYEGTLIHELGHQLQELRWKDKNGDERVPPVIPRFFGFEPAGRKGSENLDVYNIIDREGRRWQSTEVTYNDVTDDRWMPVRNGKVSTNPAESISNSEMRARIPDDRKPASDYFPHPDEAHAETLAMLFLDSRRLYHINPKLHAATKSWDQSDINHRFGFKQDEHGWTVPKMIRGTDGSLVQNTPENRKQISATEERWKHEPKETFAPVPHSDRRCNCHH